MRPILIFLFFIIPYVSLAVGNLEITDGKTVAELMEIQNLIDSISSAITECMESGSEHNECMCRSRRIFSRFTVTVHAFFTKHPELEGQDLVNFRTHDGTIINQSLLGIRKQSQLKLECEQ